MWFCKDMYSRNDAGEKKKGRGRPTMQYIDDINTWTRGSLEQKRKAGHRSTLPELLYDVTLPFNVGRPFCLMNVSQWLHNLQPKRHKRCMYMPEQFL